MLSILIVLVSKTPVALAHSATAIETVNIPFPVSEYAPAKVST